MAISDLKYHETTEKVIGCAMKVHRYFGPGFPEVVYKRALIVELEKIPLEYGSEIERGIYSEIERGIYYEGRLIAKRRLDLIVNTNILVELKAIAEIDKACYAQVINYLKVFDIETGLFIKLWNDQLAIQKIY